MLHSRSMTSRIPTLDVPNPPRVPTQCQPYTFTWSGGIPPYVFSIVSPHPPPVTSFSGLSGNSFVWDSDVPSGYEVAFKLEDSLGTFIQTSTVTVRRGVDDSCLNGAPEPPSSTQPDTTPATPTSSNPEPSPSNTAKPTPSPSLEPSGASTNSPSRVPPSTDADSAGNFGTTSAGPPADTGSSSPHPPTAPISESINTNSAPGATTIGNGTGIPSGSSYTPSHATDVSSISSSTQTARPTLSPAGEGPHNAGVIAGIILGVIAFFSVLSIAVVWFRKSRRTTERKRPMQNPPPRSSPSGTGSIVYPFDYDAYPEDAAGGSKHAMPRRRPASSVATAQDPVYTTATTEPSTPLTILPVASALEDIDIVPAPHDAPQPTLGFPRHSLDGSVLRGVIASGIVQAVTPTEPANTVSSGGDVKLTEGRPMGPAPRGNLRRQMHRPPTYEIDGGVRLAGGPPGEEMTGMDYAPDADPDLPSILPPPYRRY